MTQNNEHKGVLLEVREVLENYQFSECGCKNNEDVMQALTRLDALIAAVPDLEGLKLNCFETKDPRGTIKITTAAKLLHDAVTEK